MPKIRGAEPQAVAEWMAEQVAKGDLVYQEVIVHEIADRFGARFVYDNERGNPAIDREVLNIFRRLTKEKVVWSRADRAWRLREKGDDRGREQP